jgi:hypothetical protein
LLSRGTAWLFALLQNVPRQFDTSETDELAELVLTYCQVEEAVS